MNLKNNFKIENYSGIWKIQWPQFIILPQYIIFKSIKIITSILLKNIKNENLLTKSSK